MLYKTISIAVYAIPTVLSTYLGIQKTPQVLPAQVQEVQVVEEEAEPPSRTVEEMIVEKFGKDAPMALKIAKCESGLNPNAKNRTSTASGVFQIIRGTWAGNTDESWDKRFDAQTNIDTAYTLFKKRGFQPWECAKKI